MSFSAIGWYLAEASAHARRLYTYDLNRDFRIFCQELCCQKLPLPPSLAIQFKQRLSREPTRNEKFTQLPIFLAVASGSLTSRSRATRQNTHIYDSPARPLLPGEVHELVFGALEDTDGALAKVGGDVELVPSLVGHFHLARLEAKQRLILRANRANKLDRISEGYVAHARTNP